jgi:hypothetical protein
MAYKLAIDLDKINEIEFSYQVGTVKTTTPWNRPTYDAIKKFLRDDIVQSVLKKYNAYIMGAILWDLSKTWDVDISLKYQNGNHPNTLEEFVILENDLYSLYDIALNKYSILIDVYYRTMEHKLPTKQELISYNNLRNIENINDWTYEQETAPIFKIGYNKKVIGDSTSETILYDIEKFPLNKKLTNLHLVKAKPFPYPNKVISRIMNSTKEVLTSYFTVEEYLSMDINGPTNY